MPNLSIFLALFSPNLASISADISADIIGKIRWLSVSADNILLLTNHAGKNEIIAPKELIIAQVAKPRGQ